MTIAEIWKKIRKKYPEYSTLAFGGYRNKYFLTMIKFEEGKVVKTLSQWRLMESGDHKTAKLLDQILEKMTVDQPSIVINGELSEQQRGELGFFS